MKENEVVDEFELEFECDYQGAAAHSQIQMQSKNTGNQG